MDRLWAPWRKAYIRPKVRSKGCLFCRLVAAKRDAAYYILKRSRFSFAVLNLFPYNNGHLMIVPKRHAAAISNLSDEEKLDWLRLYDEVVNALRRSLKPHGLNVGINLGRVSGAGVPGHLHLHVVPRWRGDSNFMPVLADTKVISESLDSVYRDLSRALKVSRVRRKKTR